MNIVSRQAGFVSCFWKYLGCVAIIAYIWSGFWTWGGSEFARITVRNQDDFMRMRLPLAPLGVVQLKIPRAARVGFKFLETDPLRRYCRLKSFQKRER